MIWSEKGQREMIKNDAQGTREVITKAKNLPPLSLKGGMRWKGG